MQSFLSETIQQLLHKERPLSEYLLIVPSKRAGGFLRQELVKEASSNFFAPTILSIEEFVANISGLQLISKTELLLESYKVYKRKREEPFPSYLSWIEPVLNDFSEIDRHLVNQKEIFSKLSSIKLLEKWDLSEKETPMMKDYFSFWESIHAFYTDLTETLLEKQQGYQGLLYRKAVEELEFYLEKAEHIPHAFIGFNAMNRAEQTILQELLERGNTEVFWDMDALFAEDPEHSVSYFYRNYMKTWKWYSQHPKPTLGNHFGRDKTFHIVEAQSDIEQVKYVGSLLSRYSEEQLSKTAVVLADESLLIPLLHSLPHNVQKVNVTMGYPMKSIPAAQFFLQWLEHSSNPRSRLYYRTLQKLLNHPVGQSLSPSATDILKELAEKNRTHLTLDELVAMSEEGEKENLRLLFANTASYPLATVEAAIALLEYLLDAKGLALLDQMVFHRLWTLFQEIRKLQSKHNFLESNDALKRIFEMMLYSESLDMEGDAYQGLQIMGMLETRVLDFENVILLSVNEGTLPTGKSHASYLPYDLKKEVKLPLHTEKDAIYAYHFFRLLQRSSTATLVYNASSKGLSSGEKSRFLLQLEIERQPLHSLQFTHVQQKVKIPDRELSTYDKNMAVMTRLQEIAAKGFSPSALTSYVRNPKEFYHQRILRVQELEEVEETVAYNTLGTIVHGALELLYKPLKGQTLSIKALKQIQKTVDNMVDFQFREHYKLGDYKKGKNLIIFEVAKRYVHKVLEWDQETIRNGATIELLDLESQLHVPLTDLELGFPVFLYGMVDRIDRVDGQLRIIDYKTGKVEARFLKLANWEDLLENYDYSKAFQVLTYAYMQHKTQPFKQAQAGILSFKSMNQGFIPFSEKDDKLALVNEAVLQKFEESLFLLIRTICDPNVPFVEKEIKEKSW